MLRSTTVNPENHTVRADAGCTWGDVDHATVAFGMATPSGFLASTGVAGLTLGGGIGYLARRFGLTVDNLLSADVVLADGSFVTATAGNEHAGDLFELSSADRLLHVAQGFARHPNRLGISRYPLFGF